VRLTAAVPATSANLGPGFDCFGLALDLVNEVVLDTEGSPGVTWEGEGADDLPTDGTDLITRSMVFVAHEAGLQLPAFALHGVNRIPMERGLGSSCAAAVAGMLLVAHLLADGLGQELAGDPAAVFRLASRVEGHPDNAAAAVYGGFTLAPQDGEVVRLDPHPSLRPVVLIPERERLSTAEARRALASLIPRQDAVYNLSHAALMVVAMTERPDLLPLAMRDRLHQDARLDLLPRVRDVFDAVATAGVPVAVSGSGPTLLAWERDGAPIPDPGAGWRVVPLGVRAEGATVTEG
jgi:homoserine kinase